MYNVCLTIDSNLDKRSGDTDENFTIELPRRIKNVKNIIIKNACIPYTFYMVRTGVNDTIKFTDSADSDLTCTISPGNYTADTLATEIDTKLTDASSDTYTVTFNDDTHKFTIVSSSASFVLQWSTTTNSIANVLGWEATDTSAGATQTSTNCANLFIPYINVKSSALSSGIFYRNYHNKNESDIILRVPVDVSAGNMLTYSNRNYEFAHFTYDSKYKYLDKIDLKLEFPNGETIDLNGGSSWSIELSIVLDCVDY